MAADAPRTEHNPNCPDEEAFFFPSGGQDIVLAKGYKIEVFAKGLNFPTAIAFQGSKNRFSVFVLESGTGLPSACNQRTAVPSPDDPFTPDILVFDQDGRRDSRFGKVGIGKPGFSNGSFQEDGPAIGLAFENVFGGGRLFGTDSNQGVRGAPARARNSSRVVTIDVGANSVKPFITELPTGDHPTEQILVKDGFVYWSQGSTTNSGVVGHDNGGAEGPNQHEIACQEITLSNNLFDSGDGHMTSGYSVHGADRRNQTIRAFEGAKKGMCSGAILRARTNAKDPVTTIEPFSWGYRNPFGIRFPPKGHPIGDALFVTENGEDERGARPTNNAPDRLQIARQNPDGTPDYHGWPDRFGFLDSTQAIFNPIKGPNDDLCQKPQPPFPACDPAFQEKTSPVKHVLAFPPQPPLAPLAIEPADVAVVGPDFAPDSFVSLPVRRGAALVAREGDFGFSPGNGKPNVGHDIELVNFNKKGQPLKVELSRFAFNCREGFQDHLPDGSAACKSSELRDTGQAFANELRGINRPLTVMFGPDGALYLVDYGAVRDVGRSDPNQKFRNQADAPLVQIPHTGVIWKITPPARRQRGDDDDDDD